MKLFCITYLNLRTNLVPLKTGNGFLAMQSKISLYSLAKIYIYINSATPHTPHHVHLTAFISGWDQCLWCFSRYSELTVPLDFHLCLAECECMLSCSVLLDSLWPHRLKPTRLLSPWGFPGKNTGVGCHFLLQGIFLSQGSNLCLLHQHADSLLLNCMGHQYQGSVHAHALMPFGSLFKSYLPVRAH